MAEMSEKRSGWFAGRIPDGWFSGPPEVTYDREEILVLGTLAEPEGGESDEAKEAAREGRVRQFREDTRDQRIRIAREGERRYGPKVAWGGRIGHDEGPLTTLSVPVTTRPR